MAKKQVKVGVLAGGGPPPGYQWNVYVLELAFDEAIKAFSPGQYQHLVLQVQELARELQPSHSRTVDVDAIEDFYELKERGGVLGAVNARVFFGIDSVGRAIVVLGAINKQNNGPTPLGDKVRMRRRWRKYRNGDYGQTSG